MAALGFSPPTRDVRLCFGLDFAICRQMVKGYQVYVIAFVGKVKAFTRIRERELDGKSKKVTMNKEFGTFKHLEMDMLA